MPFSQIMVRMTGTFVLLISSLLAAQNPAPPETPTVTGVATYYRSFADITPTLLNTTSPRIFLSRIWPTAARLERLNAMDKNWEPGAWPIRCGTVAHSMEPIEIKPAASIDVQLEWQRSVDDIENPHWFVTTDSIQRPLSGEYRLVIEYAREPWTIFHRPKQVLRAVSIEFGLWPDSAPWH